MKYLPDFTMRNVEYHIKCLTTNTNISITMVFLQEYSLSNFTRRADRLVVSVERLEGNRNFITNWEKLRIVLINFGF